ncbi:hypothetical protein CC2G_013847 [Coprinopsis cinerea AmutBmut pab1-1]|nr:hypothetical protein CC2G_013847 [Coprinopsis cinerea AmutBmut pab1-1]
MGVYDPVLGTLLIGVAVNTYLYGVVSHQYVRYYSSKFNDPLRIKVSVLALLTFDTVHTVLMIYLCWVYLVDNFANPGALSQPQWPCGFIPIGTAITASITHTFLGFRIYGMLKNRPLFVVILALTLAEFATALALSIRMWTLDRFTLILLSGLKPFIIPWLLIQCTLDIIVSGVLSGFLHRHRTGHLPTDSVINRLIRGAIQTGAFSTILAITGLIVFLVRPDTILHAMFMIPIGRTYTTTLMDTLNVRTHLKDRLMNSDDNALPDQTWGNAANPESGILENSRPFSARGRLSDASPYLPAFPRTESFDNFSTTMTTNKPSSHHPDFEFTASITLPKPPESRTRD